MSAIVIPALLLSAELAMDLREALVTQLEALERRLALLWDAPEGQPELSMSRDQALEELGTTIEELHVAAEELGLAGEAIADERRRYQELFEFAPDAYAATDPD